MDNAGKTPLHFSDVADTQASDTGTVPRKKWSAPRLRKAPVASVTAGGVGAASDGAASS